MFGLKLSTLKRVLGGQDYIGLNRRMKGFMGFRMSLPSGIV